jgi:hypothetical protein
VTDGRGDNGVFPFEVVIDAFEPTEGFGDVRGDGRFFGDDEGFSHERIGRDLYLSDQVPGKEFFWQTQFTSMYSEALVRFFRRSPQQKTPTSLAINSKYA